MLLSTMHSLYILKNLCDGAFSYDTRWEVWKRVLSSKEAKEYFSAHYKDVTHESLYDGRS
jgi:hypothetical protein